MGKKFVRGITDIKNIEHQDFDTNNVNDLLSDGQNNYIHRKKGNSEEYHNLTNNIKTIQSDNTDLLTVTNYNNTTNSATIRPKHDVQKEQVLESTDNTILIEHGENGTEETTSVVVNPEKVMLNENLLCDYGITKSFTDNQTTLSLQPELKTSFDLNTLFKGKVAGQSFSHSPGTGWFVYDNEYMRVNNNDYIIQTATRYKLSDVASNEVYMRTYHDSMWTEWSKQVTDESVLSTKQNTLTTNNSIGVDGTGLRQLYTQSQTYTHANGILKTHVKSVANSTSISTAEEEFHFLAKLDKGETTASFTLNDHDKQAFSTIINTYGLNGTVNINGSAYSLNEATSTLTFLNNSGATNYNPHMTSFSDIITINQPTNTPQSSPSRGDSMTVEKVDEIVDNTDETDKVDENVDSKQSE